MAISSSWDSASWAAGGLGFEKNVCAAVFQVLARLAGMDA